MPYMVAGTGLVYFIWPFHYPFDLQSFQPFSVNLQDLKVNLKI